MILATLASFVAFSATPQAEMIELGRKFKAGEKLTYLAKATFTEEQRAGDLQTFLPGDFDISYRFSMDVKKLKADGIADLVYTRPTMTITEGDSADSAAKSTTEKTDFKYALDVSPVNEILAMKDLNPPKPKPKDKPAGGDSGMLRMRSLTKGQTQSDGIAVGLLGEFVGEIQRLAFFVGSLDSGLDIAPKMPFEEVKVGSTWQKTVAYSPQKLKGKGDKVGVQRLDYTYTYQGVTKSKEGKDVYRIQGKVKLDTDLAEFARQLSGDTSKGGSGLVKSIPLKFEATIDFDLDLKTMHTLKAAAASTGSYSLNIKGREQAYIENRFRGRTLVKLEKWEQPAPVKPVPASAPKKKGTR